MSILSFTAFLKDDPIRFMVGHHCDNVSIIRETPRTITLSIRPGSLSSERLTIHKGVWVPFMVTGGQCVKVLYKQRKSGGFQLCFDATMHVKIYRPRFLGVE